MYRMVREMPAIHAASRGRRPTRAMHRSRASGEAIQPGAARPQEKRRAEKSAARALWGRMMANIFLIQGAIGNLRMAGDFILEYVGKEPRSSPERITALNELLAQVEALRKLESLLSRAVIAEQKIAGRE